VHGVRWHKRQNGGLCVKASVLAGVSLVACLALQSCSSAPAATEPAGQVQIVGNSEKPLTGPIQSYGHLRVPEVFMHSWGDAKAALEASGFHHFRFLINTSPRKGDIVKIVYPDAGPLPHPADTVVTVICQRPSS
jgi:hypothetical protein